MNALNLKRITEFYGFSEFFYTMQDILNIGGPYSFYNYVEQAKVDPFVHHVLLFICYNLFALFCTYIHNYTDFSKLKTLKFTQIV